jgi:hypothetical protein
MMKRFGLWILVGLLMMTQSPIVKAQDYYATYSTHKPVTLGLTFSPNISWLRYGDDPDFKSQAGLGFAYGLMADFALAENYYLASGLLINQVWSSADVSKLSDIDPFWGPTKFKYHYRFQYAEIPVALKLRSAMRYHRSYYGKFGFTAGVKLSGKYKINEGQTRYNNEDMKILRLGLQVGGGAEWQLDHNLRMMTGLSFNNGLTKIMKYGEPKDAYLSLDFGFFF